DPLVALQAQAEAYIRFGVEHPEHYRVAFMDRTGFTPDQYLQEMIAEGTAFSRAVETLEALIATGRVRESLLVDGALGLALQLWAQVHGLTSLLIAKSAAPWPPLDRIIAVQADLLVAGLLCPAPT
ncbi:MAG TPA: TetR-like C-terminal domain-containing protein, partial [Acidimicrobiales bacterium]